MNKSAKFSLLIVFIFSTSSVMTMFERGDGFWSNQDDESKINFFGKLTDPKSQRENWYKVSPYVAEFLCTISNAGFIYVGIQNNSPELIFAGLASIASHSIPKQWLLYLDKLGVAVALSKVVREYQIVIDNPILTIPGALAGLIGAADVYLARKKGYTLPHVAWHLSAAVLAHCFLQYTQE